MLDEIKKRIPQREPFLFVDRILEESDQKIITGLQLTGNESFFQGHFPGNPIMPGVLLQEAIFQSGALLMSRKSGSGLGVVTRVQNAKFKNMAKPNDLLMMEVELIEQLANASFMKGKTTVNGKVIMSIEFAVATVNS